MSFYLDELVGPTDAERQSAFLAGFGNSSILTNPYQDGTTEARAFVDGWVAGYKEYGPR